MGESLINNILDVFSYSKKQNNIVEVTKVLIKEQSRRNKEKLLEEIYGRKTPNQIREEYGLPPIKNYFEVEEQPLNGKL